MDYLESKLLDELRNYDTPTVCNVIELWNIRPRNQGYMDKSIGACFPKLPPMVGYAVTSTFRSMAPPRDGDVYSSLTRQTEILEEMPAPGVIVFQDLDGPSAAATFGEVMCSVYKSFGAAGLITSGTGRDLDQVEEIDFPVFTNGTVCAHGYCHIIDINVPVTAGGINIHPDHLLHGDRNGVTTIPHEIASEIPGACEELMAAEQIILDYVRGGNVTSAGFGEARKASTEEIRKLGERLRG